MANETTPENKNAVAVTKRSPMRSLGIFILTLAMVVLIVVFYLGFSRLLGLNTNLAKMAASLSTQVTQNQNDLVSMQRSLNDSQQTLTEQLAKQQQTISQFTDTQQEGKDQLTVTGAEYLVKLANDNLLVGDNIPLVITLLQNADQEIRDISDSKITPLRKALADDIAALQAVSLIDITGTYLKLSALNAEVDKLPLPNKRPAAEQNQTPMDSQKSWWRRGLQQSLNALHKIVIVRYNTPGVRPFILPEQQEFLYQNIHALYEQAMSAVVHRQPEIYRTSLQQVDTWIKQFFLPDSPVTQAQEKGLTDLQALTINPTLPTVSASLQAFHDYLAQNDHTAQASAKTP
jgi:uroporphyrin-III C-methyltransferase